MRDAARAKAKPALPLEYNLLLTATLCLLAFGAVMVYSASSARALLQGQGDRPRRHARRPPPRPRRDRPAHKAAARVRVHLPPRREAPGRRRDREWGPPLAR